MQASNAPRRERTNQHRGRRRKHRQPPVTKTEYRELLSLPTVRYMILTVVTLMTVIMLYGSVKSSVAHQHFTTAKNGLKALTAGQYAYSTQYIEAAQAALALYPERANYHETLGSLYEHMAVQINQQTVIDKADMLARREWLLLAQNHYESALLHRPYWPVTHANLAMVKWRQNTIDDALFVHVEKAHEYGAMKTEVHQFMAHLGASLYLSQHPYFLQAQTMFSHHFEHGLRDPKSRQTVQALINERNIQLEVCQWLGAEAATITFLKCNTPTAATKAT